MKNETIKIKDLKIFNPHIFEDERGSFIKIFSKENFAKQIQSFDCQESYYTISKRNVIRGMHFQIPPFEHAKIIYVIDGLVLDVLLDIRRKSPTYGKFYSQEISGENPKCIYVPIGFAHGFKVLSQKAKVNYLQSSIYSPKHDRGIHYNSFGFNWHIKNPIISKRDLSFPKLQNFKTPF